MKKQLFSFLLLLSISGSVVAQNVSCLVTITKSGTGLNRTYTASSSAIGAAYKMSVYTDWVALDSSNTNTLTVNYSYGGYYNIDVEAVAPNCIGYLSIKDTLAEPINCSLPYSNFGISSFGAGGYEHYFANWYLPVSAPGYAFTRQLDFGDGTVDSNLYHTYVFPKNNTKVTYTATYTHPTFASCTLSGTAQL